MTDYTPPSYVVFNFYTYKGKPAKYRVGAYRTEEDARRALKAHKEWESSPTQCELQGMLGLNQGDFKNNTYAIFKATGWELIE